MTLGDNRQSARIFGLEFGLTSLSDHSGCDHPSSPQALAQHLSEAGQLRGLLMGLLRSLRGKSKAHQGLLVSQDFQPSKGQGPAPSQRQVLRSLSAYRNFPLIFSMVIVVTAMVKLAAGTVKVAIRHAYEARKTGDKA